MNPDFLLQYKELGLLALFSVTIIGALWKHILTLNAKIYSILGRYEALVTDMVKKETQLESVLEKIQDGFAAKNLIEKYVRELGKERE